MLFQCSVLEQNVFVDQRSFGLVTSSLFDRGDWPKDFALPHYWFELEDDAKVALLDGHSLFVGHDLDHSPRLLVWFHFPFEFILLDAENVSGGADALHCVLVRLVFNHVLLSEHLALPKEANPKSLYYWPDILSLFQLNFSNVGNRIWIFHGFLLFNNDFSCHFKFSILNNIHPVGVISFIVDNFVPYKCSLLKTVK